MKAENVDHEKDLTSLRKLLDEQVYDKYYQDIEVLDFKGYSDSRSSWERITKLGIDWRGNVVCDLGCFHGYFAMKVEEEGAVKVYGLERSLEVISLARAIGLQSRSNVEYICWQGGEPTPKCDIVLVLNMLHHCSDQGLTLGNLNTTYAVFEVNSPQINLIAEYFDVISITPGREYENIPNRVIVYAKKK